MRSQGAAARGRKLILRTAERTQEVDARFFYYYSSF
jgi:hypothetical protein